MKILEKLSLDELVMEFASRDHLKPAMLKPCLVNGFVIATNGHVLIKIKQELLSGSYSIIEGFPNTEKILNSPRLEQPVIYNKEELRKQFEKYKIVPLYDMRECIECNGDGYLECNLGHGHECKKCNGEGERKGGIIGDEFYYDRSTEGFELSNASFNPNYIYMPIKIADALEEETITLVSGPSVARIFEIGQNTTIVVMPIFKLK